MRVALLLIAAGTPQAGASLADTAWLAGVYDAISFPVGSCELSIDSTLAYTRWCTDDRPPNGSVVLFGNIIALELPPHQKEAVMEADRLYREDAREHARAARAYVQQQFDEHGYYPSIAPFPPSELDGTGIPVAPVRVGEVLYLVDLFDREAFCVAVLAGQSPRSSNTEHPTYRRRGLLQEAHGLSAKAFCDPDWRLRFE